MAHLIIHFILKIERGISDMVKACCVTGHRDIPADKVAFITEELRKQITQAIDDGFTLFISGFAKGVDMVFARLIVEFREKHPGIYLEAAYPYASWMKNRSAADRAVSNTCVCIGIHGTKGSRDCYLARNRFMVMTCARVIAVYDGRESGGTVNTIRYAHVLEKDLRVIEI
jgi:uncharacterized phage-like protein YoqJ